MCEEDFCEHFDFSQKVSGLLQDFRECVQDLLAQYGDIQIPIFYNRRWTSKAFKRFLTFPKKFQYFRECVPHKLARPRHLNFNFGRKTRLFEDYFDFSQESFRTFSRQ